MGKITFREAIMLVTSTDELRAYARIALINPKSLDDFQLANKILNNNLSVEEAQELIKENP